MVLVRSSATLTLDRAGTFTAIVIRVGPCLKKEGLAVIFTPTAMTGHATPLKTKDLAVTLTPILSTGPADLNTLSLGLRA